MDDKRSAKKTVVVSGMDNKENPSRKKKSCIPHMVERPYLSLPAERINARALKDHALIGKFMGF